MTRIKQSDVLREVQSLADEIVRSTDEELSDEAARAMVWVSFPELYAEYREGQPDVQFEVAKQAPPEPTLADAIATAVAKRADHLLWKSWPDKKIEDLRADLWLSPEGQQLIELARSPYGQEPLWRTRTMLSKSAAYAEAWLIYETWR